MIVNAMSPRRLMQLGGLVAVLILAAVGAGQETNTASAAHTEIFLSTSSVSPIHEPSIILHPGGQRDLYIWAKGVDDPTGVSGFTLALTFDETTVSVSAAPDDNNGIGDPVWLGSTGRSGACLPESTTPQPGRIVGGCTTILTPPPYGPTGDGLLGHIVVEAGSEFGSTLLHLLEPEVGSSSTHLVNTPIDPDDIQRIPAQLRDSVVLFMRCADNSGDNNDADGDGYYGDGRVDLPNDILGVILNYTGAAGFTPGDPAAQGTPGIKDNYDLNFDAKIDLPSDVLGTILQYDTNCWQQ